LALFWKVMDVELSLGPVKASLLNGPMSTEHLVDMATLMAWQWLPDVNTPTAALVVLEQDSPERRREHACELIAFQACYPYSGARHVIRALQDEAKAHVSQVRRVGW
jgi:hypothetical protein